MKPDKGNGVVILSKNDYNKKMDEILSDTSKFELLNDDTIKLTLKRESQVKTLLRKLKADNCINERTHNDLYPTGTRIGILSIWTSRNLQILYSFKTYSIFYLSLFV